ncbi:MAG: hypothetical protein NZ899_06210 [Thermoguttaceae bacterium]|nr:hypothetical protein [Thermoguttaceae bacterium]MDW8079246.1 hypothetical protein [Thermoguttaceae bacterium]
MTERLCASGISDLRGEAEFDNYANFDELLGEICYRRAGRQVPTPKYLPGQVRADQSVQEARRATIR